MKYVRKPKEVEAMLYYGTNALAINEWSNGLVHEDMTQDFNGHYPLVMMTKYGKGFAKLGTWVIKGPCGLFYPCSDKEFKDNYWKLAE